MIMRTETEMRRKRYAMQRLSLAMKRLVHAGSATERIMATRWVVAWGAAVGERRFTSMWHDGAAHAGVAPAPSHGAASRTQ